MLSGRLWRVLAGLATVGALLVPAGAEQYSLRFNKSSSRMSRNPSFPGWSYRVPVRLSAAGDSTAMMRLSASASMGYTLDQRNGLNTWQDNASIRGSIHYPILGPRASIGVNTSMSTRNASLQKQKIRSQTYGFSFQFRPFQEGLFRSMSVGVTPGRITAQRASRVKPDSTIEESGIQYSASLSVSPSFDVADQKMSTSLSLRKRDNTLKNNKDRNEAVSMSWRYNLPRDVRTSLSLSESRTERGVTRSVISVDEVEEEVFRDTAVVAEISQNRNTSLSSSVSVKVRGFDVSNSGRYSQSLNTNTANAAEDPGNRYFGRDRESTSWGVETKVSGKLAEWLVGRTTVKYNGKDRSRRPVALAGGQIMRDPTDDVRDRDMFFTGSLDWDVAEDHRLTLSGQVRAIRVDNPGAPEQDRDTVTRTSRLSYSTTRPSGLKVDLGLNTSFSHRVSLHASRSSNNSRNRDIVLDAKTRYERLGASLSHNFGISARRTVYDFDRQVNRGELQRKSNIRRGWSMAHSVSRTLFGSLRLNSRYSYKADDFGKLIVENGAQLVEEDNNDHNLSFGTSYSPSSALSTSLNYTYRLNRKWDHSYISQEEQRLLKSRNQHQNLGSTINYQPSTTTRLTGNWSRSRQRSGVFDSFGVTYTRTI